MATQLEVTAAPGAGDSIGAQCALPDEIRISILKEPELEDRYTRLSQLGWNRDFLRDAYAVVVGAGALGNEVLKNLALLGWGHILIVDMDTIEDTNLARSVLFRKQDADQQRPKAIVAAERVRELNPDVEILPVVATVQEGLGLGIFRRADVVFGCLDNRQARLDVSRACFQTQTPYIDGGLSGIDGDVQVFVPPYTACYGCTISAAARQRAADRHQCLKLKAKDAQQVIPTAPTASAIVAGWQTQIAVKLLHGRSVPAGERIALFGGTDVVEKYTLLPNPTCEDHAPARVLQDAEIVQAPLTAQTATLRSLVEYARDVLGMGDEAIIMLDFDVLLTGQCPTGCHTQEYYRRQESVWVKEIICPKCGALLNIESEHRFDGAETYADRTLAELGVPPLHVLTVANYPRRLYRQIELAGDLADFFAGMTSPTPKLIPIYLTVDGADRGAIMVPHRHPVHFWLPTHLAADAGTATTLDPANWRLTNVTQGFTYESNDSLLSRQTASGDRIELVTAER